MWNNPFKKTEGVPESEDAVKIKTPVVEEGEVKTAETEPVAEEEKQE